MKVLEISTAMDCPFRCTWCPQEKAIAAYNGPRLMTMNTFKSAIHNAIMGGVELVSFAGFAEPFLHPMCVQLMTWAAHALPVVLYTTCVGMTAGDVWALTQLKPQAVTIHLPDAQGNMKFEVTPQYVEVVKQLIQTSLDVRLMAMGSVHPMLADLLKGRDVGGLESMQTRAGNVGCMPVRLPQRGALKCGPAPDLDHPVMLPSGELLACCQCWSMEHILGNLATQTWQEIYSGSAFKSLVEAMESQNETCLCRRCEYAVATGE